MQGPVCHGSGDAKREHSAMGSGADLHAVHARNSQMQDLLEYLETGREALAHKTAAIAVCASEVHHASRSVLDVLGVCS